MNNLYGPKFIEKQRSSGYKSTVHAMAEIVDNSVDAEATRVDIVIKQIPVYTGTRSSISISEIFFLDNGKGMTDEQINKCLTFSEGEGGSGKRIGKFGVGLPNSSISVGRRVEVYSRTNNSRWRYVFLDLDDQINREEPGYDTSIESTPLFDKLIEIPEDCRTIVRWSKIDLIETSNIDILKRRLLKYLGRIYRYKLNNGLKINFTYFIEGNSILAVEPQPLIPYDPLFVTETKNYITDLLWKSATDPDLPRGKHPIYGNEEAFQSITYYKKFTEGCIENQTSKAIFQRFNDYWDVEYSFNVGPKTFKWKIRAAFTYKDIRTPGRQDGGNTELGREIGKKMTGDKNDRIDSANIFFMRGEREIDFGNYGLYKVTDETNRFWSIEIHFDQDLDELMGVSNTKQSIGFKPVSADELENIDAHEDMPIGLIRDLLYHQITEVLARSIKEMRKIIAQYAKEWKHFEASRERRTAPGKHPIPEVEPAVIQVLPKGFPWSEEQKHDVSNFLKEKFMHLEIDVIKTQVENFSRGLSNTLVLYAENGTGNLFELIEKRGIKITIINTNHIYYTNIIEPLKKNNNLKVFAIAIEMLISSCAYEMEKLILDDADKYERPLNRYLLLLSSRLSEFINDGQIEVNTNKWEELLSLENLDMEED